MTPNLTGKVLLIRCDASAQVGAGHLMRCFALAQAWRGLGGDVAYVGAGDCSWAFGLFEKLDAQLVSIDETPGGEGDAAATAKAAEKFGADWMVADAIYFDEQFQSRLRQSTSRLLVMDDNASQDSFDADTICNPNLHADSSLYTDISERVGSFLLGPKFIFLREDILAAKRLSEKARGSEKLLLTMGGSDPENVTGRVLEGMRNGAWANLDIRVIVGKACPHLEAIQKIAARFRHAEVLCNPPNLGTHFLWADGVISAAGSTCWELLYLGVPSAVVAIAENQEGNVDSLATLGLAEKLDLSDLEGGLNFVLDRLLKERDPLRTGRGRKFVDGQGCRRVIEHMTA